MRSIPVTTLLMFLAIGFGAGIRSEAQSSLTNLTVLQQSKWFALRGGVGNQPTAENKALAMICQQTNAFELVRRLVRSGDVEEQLYGLLGLRLLHAPDFSTELPRFLNSKKEVVTLSGCIAGSRPVAELARSIRDDHWALRSVPVPGGKYEWQVVGEPGR